MAPSGELKQWSIYEELAANLGVQTNQAAEQLLKRTLKKIAPDLLRRIDFDTEGDGVTVFADAELSQMAKREHSKFYDTQFIFER
jgi:hypothetical protein